MFLKKLVASGILTVVELCVVVGYSIASYNDQRKTNKKLVEYHQQNLAKDIVDIAKIKEEKEN